MRFGKLTVIRRALRRYIYWLRGIKNSEGYKFLCRCDCGKEVFVCSSHLNSGAKKRCGQGMCRGYTHGLFTGMNWRRNRRSYASWQSMKDRCLNPTAANYKDYGGRGVTVCDRW